VSSPFAAGRRPIIDGRVDRTKKLADTASHAAGERLYWCLPLIVGSMSLLGMTALLVASSSGLYLTGDSAVYVAVARNLIRGYGVAVVGADGSLHPVTHFPPLYPFVLSLSAGLSGTDVLTAGRWLQALIFGATITIVCGAVARYNRGSVLAAIVAGVFTIFGGSLLIWIGGAESEGLFLVCGTLGMLALVLYMEHPGSWVLLLASSLATAMALLTRYAGVALVGTGIVMLLLTGPISLGRRIWAAGLFACSVVPLAAWLATQGIGSTVAAYSIGSQRPHIEETNDLGPVLLAERSIGLHPVTLKQLSYGPLNVARWIVPDGLLRAIEGVIAPAWKSGSLSRALILTALVAMCAIAAFLVFRAVLLRRKTLVVPELPLHARLGIVFIAIYVSFLTLTMSVSYPSTEFSQRTLTPVYVALVIMVPGLLRRFWRGARSHTQQMLFAGVLALIMGGNIIQTGIWIWDGNLNGLGYGRREWRQSPLLAKALAVPSGQHIYTNGGVNIGLFGDRPTVELPTLGDNAQQFAAGIQRMKSELRQHTGVLVYFDRVPPSSTRYASIEDLCALVPLRVLDLEADGAIYTAAERSDVSADAGCG
jgi:4-amino-4-deoxy-L-arabinose transferase-like glycosyltransferase